MNDHVSRLHVLRIEFSDGPAHGVANGADLGGASFSLRKHIPRGIEHRTREIPRFIEDRRVGGPDHCAGHLPTGVHHVVVNDRQGDTVEPGFLRLGTRRREAEQHQPIFPYGQPLPRMHEGRRVLFLDHRRAFDGRAGGERALPVDGRWQVPPPFEVDRPRGARRRCRPSRTGRQLGRRDGADDGDVEMDELDDFSGYPIAEGCLVLLMEGFVEAAQEIGRDGSIREWDVELGVLPCIPHADRSVHDRCAGVPLPLDFRRRRGQEGIDVRLDRGSVGVRGPEQPRPSLVDAPVGEQRAEGRCQSRVGWNNDLGHPEGRGHLPRV